MFSNALQAWQGQPSDTMEGPDPATTCRGTQGHRLPSEEEQGPLPHPSAHRSSAQSEPRESRAPAVSTVSREWLCTGLQGTSCVRAQSQSYK